MENKGEAVFSYAGNEKHARGRTVQGGNRGAWTRSSAVARPPMHSPSLRLWGPDVKPRVPLPAMDAGMHCIGRKREGGSGHAAIALYEPDTTAMHSLHDSGQLGSFFEAPTED